MNTLRFLLVLSLGLVFFSSCRKNKPIEAEDALTYFPLSVGKYITYEMDSTNYIGYTTTPTVTKYFVKDEITSKTTDNIGRESYRIVRFIKKNVSDAWSPLATHMVTKLDKSVEVVENNLRFIKLMNPCTPTFSWNGNRYIETQGAQGGFSDLTYLVDWEYQYDSIQKEKKYNQYTFPETITVKQADATDGSPTNPNGYSERNYSVEVYAKNVGLVYKDFLHWSYQPPTGGIPGYRTGYGIRLKVIDKN